jgi:hypothetical protein
MRRLLVVVLAVALFAVPCLAGDRYENVYNGGKQTYDPAVPGPVFDGGRDILWDNGPLETQPGLSVLDTAAGMSIYGFGHQTSAGFWIADDFTIPVGETWEISEITFFAYQTGSPTNPSTITAVYLEIYDGPPDAAPNLIWGGAAVNVLTSTTWSGLYRVLDTDLLGTSRPIMANTCTIGTTLMAGTYWLVWQSNGSGASGPWAPPITIPGVFNTGNGLQNTGVWAPVLDGTYPQGFPFIVEGTHPSPVEEWTWAAVKAMFR